jgi:hypothetical protein
MKTPAMLIVAVLLAAGCGGKGSGATTKPSAKPSDKALKDPFDYSPDFSDTEIGSSRAPEFDRQGLKKDLGHVIMP